MSNHYQGKNVVVTGGAGGLGTAVVARLVDAGARCHVPLYTGEKPGALAEMPADDLVMYSGVDLSDEKAAVSFFASVPEIWASVNLSGGFAMGSLAETSLVAFDKMYQRNVITCFLSTREAAGRIGNAGGRIVNVAARPAVVPTGGMIAYSTSKAAVAALTQAAAEELRPRAIWVNAVLPSIIDTPANRAAMPAADHEAWPKPTELAETIAFLAGPGNALTTGCLVPVYGRA